MSEVSLKEYKGFDENGCNEIKKLLWHGNHMSPDGIVVDIPLDRDRFKHYETNAGEITIRFQEMIGWIILEKLVPIIVYHRPFCIVEIGAGVSTRLLAKVAEEFGVKLYSCDKSPKKNIRYIKNHIFAQKMSEDFIMEFDFFFEKLVPGGVIFLHDTYPMHQYYVKKTLCGDVYKLRQQLELRTHEMDVFTWPYTAGYHGLTMVMKKEENRPFWEL